MSHLPAHLVEMYAALGWKPPKRMEERYAWLRTHPFAEDLLAIASTNS